MSDTPSPPPPAGSPLPAGSPAPRGLIKFPVRPPVMKPLSLRGRFSLEPSQESAEARKSINAIMAATRMPWGEARPLTLQQVGELQKALRQLEGKLAERERAVTDLVARLADRERDLAAAEEQRVERRRERNRHQHEPAEPRVVLGREREEHDEEDDDENDD